MLILAFLIDFKCIKWHYLIIKNAKNYIIIVILLG